MALTTPPKWSVLWTSLGCVPGIWTSVGTDVAACGPLAMHSKNHGDPASLVVVDTGILSFCRSHHPTACSPGERATVGCRKVSGCLVVVSCLRLFTGSRT